jgi:hypothetical protein
MIGRNRLCFKYSNVPQILAADAHLPGQFLIEEPKFKKRKVCEIPSRDAKTNSFQH